MSKIDRAALCRSETRRLKFNGRVSNEADSTAGSMAADDRSRVKYTGDDAYLKKVAESR